MSSTLTGTEEQNILCTVVVDSFYLRHARTHTRTHARTHARTHTHTHTHTHKHTNTLTNTRACMHNNYRIVCLFSTFTFLSTVPKLPIVTAASVKRLSPVSSFRSDLCYLSHSVVLPGPTCRPYRYVGYILYALMTHTAA